MRIVDQPIQVRLRDGQPASFRWRGQLYQVAQVLDNWFHMGRWWAGEGEWRLWRVQTMGGDVNQQEWRLYWVYD